MTSDNRHPTNTGYTASPVMASDNRHPTNTASPVMTSDNRHPLETTTSDDDIPKRTIEETYQKLTQVEHILLRPDLYIGSIKKHKQTLWVWENEKMIKKPISYVPGLYKIFDEILVFTNNNGEKSVPSITRSDEKWTRVTFKPDLAKFGMTYLEDDVVALMKKRVVDLAGCLGASVKVNLGRKRVPPKCFKDYVKLYLGSSTKLKIYEKVNDKWEICISMADGQFEQVSFVKNIATIKGGTHVDYITNQVANHLVDVVKKKKKHANLEAHDVKNFLLVFVNALIDNPAYDSQTKETLMSEESSFGSTCKLTPDFLDKVAKSDIVKKVISWVKLKQQNESKKTDGARKLNIPKLEEANFAATNKSEDCTLILAQGDSAKSLAMSGLSVVGQDYYGVFPLRGKLLNVRDASEDQLQENAEIQNIKKILGLQDGEVYDNVNSLRYGHVMIMADQDHDGSHVKGLLINFLHSFWPSLLKIPNFLLEFITPLLKVTNKKTKEVLSFYTKPEYEAWKENLGHEAREYKIKYYKGLGTSNGKEGAEYFADLDMHKKDFVWTGDADGEAIDLAFSKKKVEDRKNWIRAFQAGTYFDSKEKHIPYRDFINKELILFSMADLQRSIPSMVDGLKPGQRKILFCAFKKLIFQEVKVSQFCGYVSEHSAYHHGDQFLVSTIIGMAQNFVGSNNINLLCPSGQFGTRQMGGKDHASGRYIYTSLSPITRYLFHKADELLLNYLNEDGQSIEPTWFMPIIPMVLVNGSEGIGTGWSTSTPNYNPRDIIANLKRLLNGEAMVPMDPWYKGFKGTIQKNASKESGFTSIGIMVEKEEENAVSITELPIRRWTQDYKEFLAVALGKDKEPFIEDYTAHNDDTTVHFEVVMTANQMKKAKQEGLLKKFKLTTPLNTSNMNLFDANGVLKKYDTPEQILENFFHLRLDFYEKRKTALLLELEKASLQLENKVRFIREVVDGTLVVFKRKKVDLCAELKNKDYTPLPNEAVLEACVAGAVDHIGGSEENEEEADEVVVEEEVTASSKTIPGTDYHYLLSMAIGTLTNENMKQLWEERDAKKGDFEELKKTPSKSLWMRDLRALDLQLDEQDKRDAKDEAERKKQQQKARPNDPGGGMSAKKATITEIVEPLETSASTSMETAAKKRRAGAFLKKGPAESKNMAELNMQPDQNDEFAEQNDEIAERDDETVELVDLLARHNIESSPEPAAATKSSAATKLSNIKQRCRLMTEKLKNAGQRR